MGYSIGRRARAMNMPEFCRKVVAECWLGHGMDGEDIQDLALKHGLLVETVFNPKIHSSDWDNEAGDKWFTLSPEFCAALGPKPWTAPTNDEIKEMQLSLEQIGNGCDEDAEAMVYALVSVVRQLLENMIEKEPANDHFPQIIS
jgi:hypothetical protein